MPSFDEESGGVWLVVLLAAAGAVVGAPLGLLVVNALEGVLCRDCGLEWLLYVDLALAIGALAGAIVGGVIGVRRSRDRS